MAQKPLRTVMIVENNSYPSDTRVRNEAETLVAAGYDVTVICPRGKDQPWREDIRGVHALRFPPPPGGSGFLGYVLEFGYGTAIAALYVLWCWVSRGLDVVHVHNPPDTLFTAGLLPKIAGKKLIYDHHDLAPELYLSKFERDGGSVHKVLLLLEKWSCRFANYVITVNESYRQQDIARNGIPADKVTIVRNGPVLSRFSLVPPDAELRARAPIIFGYVGHISRQDGLDHMLRALYHLETDLDYKDWFAVIIGRADNADELRQLAAELGITEKLQFTGHLNSDQLLPLLSAADICLVPDPSNPLNDKSTMIKVMEYMALEKPVVGYELAETKASAGDAGLYAEPNNPLAMARELQRLVEDPALRERLGKIGRKRVEDQLSWDYSASHLLEVYNTIRAKLSS
jgi:glycosyltransferase involved in cell wall biosynthesis